MFEQGHKQGYGALTDEKDIQLDSLRDRRIGGHRALPSVSAAAASTLPVGITVRHAGGAKEDKVAGSAAPRRSNHEFKPDPNRVPTFEETKASISDRSSLGGLNDANRQALIAQLQAYEDSKVGEEVKSGLLLGALRITQGGLRRRTIFERAMTGTEIDDDIIRSYLIPKLARLSDKTPLIRLIQENNYRVLTRLIEQGNIRDLKALLAVLPPDAYSNFLSAAGIQCAWNVGLRMLDELMSVHPERSGIELWTMLTTGNHLLNLLTSRNAEQRKRGYDMVRYLQNSPDVSSKVKSELFELIGEEERLHASLRDHCEPAHFLILLEVIRSHSAVVTAGAASASASEYLLANDARALTALFTTALTLNCTAPLLELLEGKLRSPASTEYLAWLMSANRGQSYFSRLAERGAEDCPQSWGNFLVVFGNAAFRSGDEKCISEFLNQLGSIGNFDGVTQRILLTRCAQLPVTNVAGDFRARVVQQIQRLCTQENLLGRLMVNKDAESIRAVATLLRGISVDAKVAAGANDAVAAGVEAKGEETVFQTLVKQSLPVEEKTDLAVTTRASRSPGLLAAAPATAPATPPTIMQQAMLQGGAVLEAVVAGMNRTSDGKQAPIAAASAAASVSTAAASVAAAAGAYEAKHGPVTVDHSPSVPRPDSVPSYDRVTARILLDTLQITMPGFPSRTLLQTAMGSSDPVCRTTTMNMLRGIAAHTEYRNEVTRLTSTCLGQLVTHDDATNFRAAVGLIPSSGLVINYAEIDLRQVLRAPEGRIFQELKLSNPDSVVPRELLLEALQGVINEVMIQPSSTQAHRTRLIQVAERFTYGIEEKRGIISGDICKALIKRDDVLSFARLFRHPYIHLSRDGGITEIYELAVQKGGEVLDVLMRLAQGESSDHIIAGLEHTPVRRIDAVNAGSSAAAAEKKQAAVDRGRLELLFGALEQKFQTAIRSDDMHARARIADLIILANRSGRDVGALLRQDNYRCFHRLANCDDLANFNKLLGCLPLAEQQRLWQSTYQGKTLLQRALCQSDGAVYGRLLDLMGRPLSQTVAVQLVAMLKAPYEDPRRFTWDRGEELRSFFQYMMTPQFFTDGGPRQRTVQLILAIHAALASHTATSGAVDAKHDVPAAAAAVASDATHLLAAGNNGGTQQAQHDLVRALSVNRYLCFERLFRHANQADHASFRQLFALLPPQAQRAMENVMGAELRALGLRETPPVPPQCAPRCLQAFFGGASTSSVAASVAAVTASDVVDPSANARGATGAPGLGYQHVEGGD